MRKRRFLAIGFLDTKAAAWVRKVQAVTAFPLMLKPVALERMGWWDEGA
jgi:hypothetical protein